MFQQRLCLVVVVVKGRCYWCHYHRVRHCLHCFRHCHLFRQVTYDGVLNSGVAWFESRPGNRLSLHAFACLSSAMRG